jgi:hypothetical protein
MEVNGWQSLTNYARIIDCTFSTLFLYIMGWLKGWDQDFETWIDCFVYYY